MREVQLDTGVCTRGWKLGLTYDPSWSCFSTFLGKVLNYLLTTATLCHQVEPVSRRVGVRHNFLMY